MSKFEGVDTVVLFDEMAFEDLLVFEWRVVDAGVGHLLTAQHAERNIKVLQVCLAAEAQSAVEVFDDKNPLVLDLHRIEAKLNMVLEVLGHLVASARTLGEPRRIRFNAMGALWAAEGLAPAVGTVGELRIHLPECLALPLVFGATVIGATEHGRVRVQFAPPGEAVADLIGKLAFRRHRRQVAGVRQHHWD